MKAFIKAGILSGMVFICSIILLPTTHALTTYTVGGASPDYATIQEVIDDLEDDAGNTVELISLPITDAYKFNLRTGTFAEELLTFTAVSGASSSNTITFGSESGTNTDVVIQATPDATDNYVININGATYMTFENMTIQQTGGTTEGRVIVLDGSADNITITGNIINGVDTTSSDTPGSLAVIYSPSTSSENDFLLSDNQINYGSHGVYMFGISGSEATGVVLSGNTVQDWYRRGIFVGTSDTPTITGNTIIGDSTTVSVSYGLDFSAGKGGSITKNKIYIYKGHGIYLSGDGQSGNRGLLANNFVYSGQSGNGIEMRFADYWDVFYNTLIGGNTGATGAIEWSGTGSNNRLQNNILYQRTAGVGLRRDPNTTLSTISNNVYYSTSGDFVVWGATGYSDLATYQAEVEPTAQFVDLQFTDFDFSDLSVDLHTSQYQLNGAAAVLSEVTDDIDGDTRNATNPDIGADEFIFQNVITTAETLANPRPGSTGLYEIIITPTIPVPDTGTITVQFPAAFDTGFDALTDADVSVSATNLTSTVITFDDASNTMTIAITASADISSAIIIKIGDGLAGGLTDLTNPSISGVYSVGFNTFDEGGDLLDQGSALIEIGGGSASVGTTAIVNEALVMTMDNTSVSLQVDPSVNGGEDKSEGTILTVASNASGGYTIYGKLDDGSGNAQLVSGANSIASSTGENGFSYDATNNASSCSSPDGTKTFASSAAVLQNSSSQDVGYTEETDSYQHALCYDLNVNYNTPAGVYTGTITYTVVASF